MFTYLQLLFYVVFLSFKWHESWLSYRFIKLFGWHCYSFVLKMNLSKLLLYKEKSWYVIKLDVSFQKYHGMHETFTHQPYDYCFLCDMHKHNTQKGYDYSRTKAMKVTKWYVCAYHETTFFSIHIQPYYHQWRRLLAAATAAKASAYINPKIMCRSPINIIIIFNVITCTI